MSSFKRKATEALLSEAKKPKANSSITSFFGPPKVVHSTPTSSAVQKAGEGSPSLKFNKAKWVASLTPEQGELLSLEIETMHESWLAVLKEEIVTREFLELKRFLKREIDSGKTVFPKLGDVYSW